MNGRSPLPNLVVRPVALGDEARLQRLFERLSPSSVYRRFFTLFQVPPPSVLRQLTRANDDDHEELVALDGDEIVAVAGWDRVGPLSDEAEVAVMVEDTWQHRGLGRALVRMVNADAYRHGIAHVVVNILSDNDPARRLARSLGRAEQTEFEGPLTALRFRLAN
jgi:GNAT superfamily N-acetyltransferase